MAAVARRNAEALRIFEPLAIQDAFFKSIAPERVFLGGNRGGKTLTAAIECARILTGSDPYGKFPRRDGRMVAVGKSLNHCGEVMGRKLFRAGAFKMIRDPNSGLWRSYRPHDPWDVANHALHKPAPPLIPRRLIDSIAWENKKKGEMKFVRLKNGWELTFYSADGEPPNGIDVDAVWFDEEIQGSEWYPEMAARLVDRSGKFYWSATPQAGTEELFDLNERALREYDEPEPSVSVFHITMLENPHLTDKDKKILIGKITNDDIYDVRVMGKFAIHGLRIYPEYHAKGIHGIEFNQLPDDFYAWTRYCAIDPGVNVCAVLFAAVPPPRTPGFRNKVVFYDELYLKRCDADMFGDAMVGKLADVHMQKMYIDSKMAKQTTVTGDTIAQHYSKALKDRKLTCEATGSSFSWANSDVKGGIESVRKLLHVGREGHPGALVCWDRCRNFVEEAKRYSYKKKPSGEITDEPNSRKFHLMDTWRYLASANLRYHRPTQGSSVDAGNAYHLIARKKEKARLARDGSGDGIIRLG